MTNNNGYYNSFQLQQFLFQPRPLLRYCQLSIVMTVCAGVGQSCEPDQQSEGCNIRTSHLGQDCQCGLGCQREFQFLSRHQCEAALLSAAVKVSAVSAGPCSPTTCSNGGRCVELAAGGFRCYCTGTNFFGEQCEKGENLVDTGHQLANIV